MQPIQSLMLCSHLTSAFVSMSPSKFNIATIETQMQMQRMAFSASTFALLLPTVTQTQRMGVDIISVFATMNLMPKVSEYFNTHSLSRDECILLSDKLICASLKFWEIINLYLQITS